MFKKILATFLAIFLVSATVFPKAAFAQSKWYAPTYQEFTDKVNGAPDSEIFGERYTQAQVYWIINSLIAFLNGEGPSKCIATANGDLLQFVNCIANSPQGMKGSSLIQLAALSDGILSTRPASGVDYITQKINIIPTAHAQATGGSGFGFRTLEITQPLWTATRNATYSLLVLVVIILAFMVMFRRRVSPQLTVTAQSAIPRVVIGLVLITFSFAIAGLIVDLSYLVFGLIGAIISSSGLQTSGHDAIYFFNRLNDPATGLVSFAILTMANLFVVGLGAIALTVPIPGVNIGVGLLATVIVILVLIVTVIGFIRITWLLLRSYLMVLLLVIASPFFIIYGIVSFGNGFGQWLRSIVAQMSVFISVSVLIMMAHFFTWSTAAPVFSDILNGLGADNIIYQIINPYRFTARTFAGTTNFPGFGGIDLTIIGFFLGIVIILSIPGIANGIRNFIMSGRFDTGRTGVIGSGVIGGIWGGVSGGLQRGAGAVATGYIGSKLEGTRAGQAYRSSVGREENIPR